MPRRYILGYARFSVTSRRVAAVQSVVPTQPRKAAAEHGHCTSTCEDHACLDVQVFYHQSHPYPDGVTRVVKMLKCRDHEVVRTALIFINAVTADSEVAQELDFSATLEMLLELVCHPSRNVILLITSIACNWVEACQMQDETNQPRGQTQLL